MRICAQLSRLPRAGRLKSINFRHTTPGSLSPITENYLRYVDPAHPAARLNRYELHRQAPCINKSSFTLRAVPKGTLYEHEAKWPDPPYSPAPARGPGSSRVNMSLLKVISKKVHKSAVIRKTLANRIRLAMTLVVTRGAQSGTDRNGRSVLVFDEEEAGHHLVLNDWTYIVTPSLEVYRMPYPQLVDEIRDALKVVADKGKKLEEFWERRLQRPERSSQSEHSRMSTEQRNSKQFPRRLHPKAAENVLLSTAGPSISAQRVIQESSSTTNTTWLDPKAAKTQRLNDFLDALGTETPQEAPAEAVSSVRIEEERTERHKQVENSEKTMRVFGSLFDDLRIDDVEPHRAPSQLQPRPFIRTIRGDSGRRVNGSIDASVNSKASNSAESARDGSSTHPDPPAPREIRLFNAAPIVRPSKTDSGSNKEQGFVNSTSQQSDRPR